MLGWVPYVILGTVCYGLVNNLDALTIRRFVKDPISNLIVGGSMWAGLIIILSTLMGATWPPLSYILVSFLNGCFAVASVISYLKALSFEDTSKVVIVLQTSPLYVFLASVFFMKDVMPLKATLAFLIIFAGSMLASLERKAGSFRLSRGTIFALSAAFFGAGSTLCWKYLSSLPLWSSMRMPAIAFLVCLWAMVLLPSVRKKLLASAKSLPVKGWAVFTVGACAALTGRILINIALAVGPVALVASLSGFQPIFVLVWAAILGKFVKDVHEEHDRFSIFQKLVAAGLMLIGVFLLQ